MSPENTGQIESKTRFKLKQSAWSVWVRLFQQVSQFFFGILRDWKKGILKKTDRQSCVYVLFDVNEKGNTENVFIKLFSWDVLPTFRPGECWEKAVHIKKTEHRIPSSNEPKNLSLLLTDWAWVFFQLQQTDIGIVPLMPLPWFLTDTVVPGLSKSGLFCFIKPPLHMVLAGIFLGMWRKELAGVRDRTIISVLDVVPHKFMLTQCSDCRAYCEEAHHVFSASAFL